MPNWYIGNVNFTGEKENIKKLYEDIKEQLQWVKDNNYHYVGLYHLFEKNGFDCQMYNDYWKHGYLNLYGGCNFRGTICDPFIVCDNHLNCSFEMAWYMDYNMLLLLSHIYGVKFSAYGNEPSMGIYDRCENNGTNYYNGYDYALSCSYDALEEENLPLEFELVEGTVDEIDEVKKILEEHEIEYFEEEVTVIDPNDLAYNGVYYDLIRGVFYDK